MQLRFDLSFTLDTEHDSKIAELVTNLLCDLTEEGLIVAQTITPIRGGKGEVVQRDTERFKHFAPDVPVQLDPNHPPDTTIRLSNGCEIVPVDQGSSPEVIHQSMGTFESVAVRRARLAVEAKAREAIDRVERTRENMEDLRVRDYLYDENRNEALRGMTTVPHGI